MFPLHIQQKILYDVLVNYHPISSLTNHRTRHSISESLGHVNWWVSLILLILWAMQWSNVHLVYHYIYIIMSFLYKNVMKEVGITIMIQIARGLEWIPVTCYLHADCISVKRNRDINYQWSWWKVREVHVHVIHRWLHGQVVALVGKYCDLHGCQYISLKWLKVGWGQRGETLVSKPDRSHPQHLVLSG